MFGFDLLNSLEVSNESWSSMLSIREEDHGGLWT